MRLFIRANRTAGGKRGCEKKAETPCTTRRANPGELREARRAPERCPRPNPAAANQKEANQKETSQSFFFNIVAGSLTTQNFSSRSPRRRWHGKRRRASSAQSGMRRRTVCTMGAFLCLCMFLSLSMQASSLADIDDGGAVGRSAGVTPPLRVSRKSLRQRGHHDAGARDDLACDELASANPLPPAPAGSLRFFSIGDWGVRGLSVGSDAQMRVARGMSCAARRWPVRFVLTLGDNFYGSGVTSVDDAQFEHKFESVYSDASLNVPWFPALGDHDQCGDVDAQAAYSMRSERWTMPSAYYQELLSFDGGDMQLVVVDWVRLEGAFSETSGDRRFHDRLRANQAGREAADAHWAWLRRAAADPRRPDLADRRRAPTPRLRLGALGEGRRRVPGGGSDARGAQGADAQRRRGRVAERPRPHRAGGVRGERGGARRRSRRRGSGGTICTRSGRGRSGRRRRSTPTRRSTASRRTPSRRRRSCRTSWTRRGRSGTSSSCGRGEDARGAGGAEEVGGSDEPSLRRNSKKAICRY